MKGLSWILILPALAVAAGSLAAQEAKEAAKGAAKQSQGAAKQLEGAQDPQAKAKQHEGKAKERPNKTDVAEKHAPEAKEAKATVHAKDDQAVQQAAKEKTGRGGELDPQMMQMLARFEALHRDRVARINRLRQLANEKNDKTLLAKANELEQKLHEVEARKEATLRAKYGDEKVDLAKRKFLEELQSKRPGKTSAAGVKGGVAGKGQE